MTFASTISYISFTIYSVQCRCIYGDPMNRSRWTRRPESMKCSTGRYFASAVEQPVEPFFSRSRTHYWMREGGFWHPRPEIDRSISFGRPVPGGLDMLLDERGWILALHPSCDRSTIYGRSVCTIHLQPKKCFFL